MRRAMASSSGQPNPSPLARPCPRAAGPFVIWHPNRLSAQRQASTSLRKGMERLDTRPLSRRAYHAENETVCRHGTRANPVIAAGYQQKATFGSAGNLASEAELGHPQGATLGCVGSRGESESESPLPSSEAESTPSADLGGTRIATSDESCGAIPKIETSARVTSGAGEKRKLHFAPNPRVIPDAWFQLQSEGARFPS